MKLAAVLLVLAGCQATGDDFPVNPGGGGGTGGSTGGSDAAVDTGDGGAAFHGRVCLAPDLRAPTSACANAGAEAITVTLGANTATTDAAGFFTIDSTAESNLVWHATGANIVTTAMPFTPELTIPALTTTDYVTLLSANGVVLQAGQGSIVVRVADPAGPLAGAVATVAPVPQFAALYDSDVTADDWDTDATESHGVVWITGATAGTTATVTITPAAGTARQTAAPVEDGAITFVTLEFP